MLELQGPVRGQPALDSAEEAGVLYPLCPADPRADQISLPQPYVPDGSLFYFLHAPSIAWNPIQRIASIAKPSDLSPT